MPYFLILNRKGNESQEKWENYPCNPVSGKESIGLHIHSLPCRGAVALSSQPRPALRLCALDPFFLCCQQGPDVCPQGLTCVTQTLCHGTSLRNSVLKHCQRSGPLLISVTQAPVRPSFFFVFCLQISVGVASAKVMLAKEKEDV